jgi:dCMP deaminase
LYKWYYGITRSIRMSEKRQTWDEYYMTMAHAIKSRATCPRKAVGVVVVSAKNRVAGTGFNGAPSGMPHCTDVGCMMDEANHCQRVIHAEVNALLEAQRRGEIEGSTLYTTVFPCIRCLNVAIQCGIGRIVYEELYRDTTQLELAQQAGIVVERVMC